MKKYFFQPPPTLVLCSKEKNSDEQKAIDVSFLYVRCTNARKTRENEKKSMKMLLLDVADGNKDSNTHTYTPTQTFCLVCGGNVFLELRITSG